MDAIYAGLGPDEINQWAVELWGSSLSDAQLPHSVDVKQAAKQRK